MWGGEREEKRNGGGPRDGPPEPPTQPLPSGVGFTQLTLSSQQVWLSPTLSPKSKQDKATYCIKLHEISLFSPMLASCARVGDFLAHFILGGDGRGRIGASVEVERRSLVKPAPISESSSPSPYCVQSPLQVGKKRKNAPGNSIPYFRSHYNMPFLLPKILQKHLRVVPDENVRRNRGHFLTMVPAFHLISPSFLQWWWFSGK